MGRVENMDPHIRDRKGTEIFTRYKGKKSGIFGGKGGGEGVRCVQIGYRGVWGGGGAADTRVGGGTPGGNHRLFVY